MEFLQEYGLFLAKTLTVVIAITVVLGSIASIPSRIRRAELDQIQVRHLNRKYRKMRRTVEKVTGSHQTIQHRLRRWRSRARQSREQAPRQRLFLLTFHGDLRASAVAALREEITAVLMVARPGDGVLLRLESAGGLISAYGLAASQLDRIKQRGIQLTVVTDRVAASGGYLMASVANRLVAAPFAIIGSIGVIAQFPNFHRLLKKNDIDFEQYMAGEFKRTVSLFGENSDQARKKFQEDIEQAHLLFKSFLREHRPQLDLERVANGDYWYGIEARELKLVDEIGSSDDLLLKATENADIYEVTCRLSPRRTLMARLLSA